jgi:hypothetical protein
VAAIVISLITGLLGAWMLPGVIILARLGPSFVQLQDALKASDTPASITAIRDFTTESFNQVVSDEDLETWLEQVRATHGKITEWEQLTTPPSREGDVVRLSRQAKFVNGKASVTIDLIKRGLVDVKINDFSVDGISPRDMN